MRLLIIFLLLGIEAAAITSCDLPVKDTMPADYEYYYSKGMQQTTTAKILLIGGGSVAGAGLLMVFVDLISSLGGNGTGTASIGFLLGTVGLPLMLACIPFAISGVRNKRKAARLSMVFKTENYNTLRSTGFERARYPAIGFNIKF